MTAAELKNLVKKGEGLGLEFKKKADHPEKIVRELVAFANTQGGFLLVGVEDNGNISGLKFPEDEQYVIEAALSKYVKPELDLKFGIIPVGLGLSVLSIYVAEAKAKPCFWLADKEKEIFKAYVRHKDQSLKASKEMFQILKLRNKPHLARPFRLTEMERKLLGYLGENKEISIPQFCALVKMPGWKASKLFINWVMAGVLEIHPGEEFDLFSLSKSYSHFNMEV